MPAFACALLLGLFLQAAPTRVPPPPVYALVGVDEDPGGPMFSQLRINEVRRRSDSLVLVVPSKGAPARALWIPRDTLVRTSHGQDIIGHALRRGGVRRLDAVLLADFGIHVSGHAVMDHSGFVALIDAIGGVPMPDGSVADGRKVLSLARARRGDPAGDLGRVRRQMALSRQIMQAVRAAGPLRLLHILMLLPSAVRTDMRLVRGAALAYQVADRGIRAATMPGTPEGIRYRPTRDARQFARRYLLQTAPAGPGTNGG